jgi:hypothetical protein
MLKSLNIGICNATNTNTMIKAIKGARATLINAISKEVNCMDIIEIENRK